MSVDRYLSQSLGGAGFCLVSSDIAMRQRPDLWPGNGGLQCAGDFAQAHKRNQFANVPHTIRLTAYLAGVERPVIVLARSSLRLAERIEEVTGLRVEQLVEGDEEPKPAQGDRRAAWEAARQRRQGVQPAVEVAAAPPQPRREHAIPEDVQGLDIQAKEPPRPCTACGNLTNGGNCLPAMRGKWKERPPYYKPSASHPRRCLLYVPSRHLLDGEHVDMRNGAELWPELLAKAPAVQPVQPVQATPAEPVGAFEKAKALVADALKSGARPSADVFKATKDAGISERTTQRAADALGVVKTKAGFGSGWTWALPEQGDRAA